MNVYYLCPTAAPFTVYEFEVAAITKVGQGNFSPTQTFETLEDGMLAWLNDNNYAV